MRVTAPPFKEDNRLHLFSRDIAAGNYSGNPNASFDIEGAVLLTDIARNIRKIERYRDAKDQRYKRSNGWYYITVKELAERHPYLTERTVRRILTRLRKDGVLEATTKLHRRRTERTLWYSFADKGIYKEALAQEDAISFWVQDAVDYGMEAAILLHNLIWCEEHGLSKLEWIRIEPAEFLDGTNLPMTPQGVRRALSVLVKAGRLERKRNARYGNNYYKYRLVDTPHLGAYEEPDALPTESYHHPEEDDLPTEHYENLPPLTAHRQAKDKENRLLMEFAEYIKKNKERPPEPPGPRKIKA